MKPYHIYFALAGEDCIRFGNLDPETGKIDFVEDYSVPWGPETMSMDPEKKLLVIACHPRVQPEGEPARKPMFYSFSIDRESGKLTPISAIANEYAPTYVYVDHSAKHVLSAYYRLGAVSVHELNENGELGKKTQWMPTGGGAHSIMVDHSGKNVFVPHVSTSPVNIKTWKPLMSPEHFLPSASNTILQFKYDDESGVLTPNENFKIPGFRGGGPRHQVYHPNLDVVYFSNEQGCAVTAYAVDREAGTLEPMQHLSTLPDEGYDGYASCSSIRITHNGKFLYVLNRSYDSVACFAIDEQTGRLTKLEVLPGEAQCHTLEVSPDDKYLYTAGHKSGMLRTYRIRENGTLEQISRTELGSTPKWIIAID